MAIYRKGQASMDGQGYITGYGTEWRTNLTLIRSGATIVFATNPISFATISEVINDTHMRAISTGGVTVERGDYVILLHDSLTVDGLAQDVAETLRYYQSKETQFEKFIDIIGDFDWDKLAESEKVIKENAAAAAASERNAKTSETNAKTSETNSKASEQASKASQNAAAASAGAAATSERNAKASETNSGANKDAAAASAAAAKSSETNSASNKDAAAASAAAAKTSETNSESNKTAAAASAQAAKVSETNSANNKNAAAASASAAKTSETNAANSAKTSVDKATLATQQADRAKTEADRAADLATQLDATALMRKDANLSDVQDKAAGRKNLEVDRVRQFAGGETQLKSGDDTKQIFIKNNGSWGCWDQANSVAVPLSVGHGGTGGLLQTPSNNSTQLASPNDSKRICLFDSNNEWGVWITGTNNRLALPVASGGTGALNAADARKNISAVGVGEFGIGNSSGVPRISSLKDAKGCGVYTIFGDGASTPTVGTPPGSGNNILTLIVTPVYSNTWSLLAYTGGGAGVWYGRYDPTAATPAPVWTKLVTDGQSANLTQITMDAKSDAAQASSGIMIGRLLNSSNALRCYHRIYSEIRTDNKAYLTLHLRGADGSNKYLGYDQDGDLSGVRRVLASGNLKSSSSWPAVELEKTTMATGTPGRRVVIENNEASLNFYFANATDNTGRYTVTMQRPVTTEARYLAMDGGLAHNGNSNPGSPGSNFNVAFQGWTSVGGSWTNSPAGSAGTNVYGSLFTQATQGLQAGRAPNTGVTSKWYQQRFYDTSNRIYTRVQTNAQAWQPWYQVTTSAVSDERLKDIKGNLNIEGALDNINRMEFKLFTFKTEQVEGKAKTTRRGVISQQIRQIDKEYVKNVGDYWHLDQTPMLLDGLAAIKALRARDEANKARIAELESKVENMQSQIDQIMAMLNSK